MKKKKQTLGFLSCAELHRVTEEHKEQMDEGKQGGEEVKAVQQSCVCVCACPLACVCPSSRSGCADASRKVRRFNSEFFKTVRTSVYFQPGATEIFWKCWKFARSQSKWEQSRGKVTGKKPSVAMATGDDSDQRSSESEWDEKISKLYLQSVRLWVFHHNKTRATNKPTFCRVWLKSAKLMRRISSKKQKNKSLTCFAEAGEMKAASAEKPREKRDEKTILEFHNITITEQQSHRSSGSFTQHIVGSCKKTWRERKWKADWFEKWQTINTMI